jgi:hypothetical protein
MLMEMRIPECDACGAEGPIDGGAGIARGATGRWCIVMYVCGNCTDLSKALAYKEAHEKIEALGNGDWADF